MAKLESITGDELRTALAATTDHKAVQRLMIALAYTDGRSVGHLSRLYGVPQSTIYYWLDRFDERGLEEALEDEPRSGRPRKLGDEERDALAETFEAPPEEAGYESSSWSTELVREHIRHEYGVEYSLGHVRRLLREL
ncbi:helix-turn-helix domain-containing protein [Halalkalicoccus subterraneus]|uniref:helix-turn-helix domain-containing protein n=1 Tax=Halalkalicoccus subterraneus TaxID=2675002 RepID=UPI000EFB30A8|nr:helix-turn-helix domain-containing protein [Halalkalicoccus subterraneus]